MTNSVQFNPLFKLCINTVNVSKPTKMLYVQPFARTEVKCMQCVGKASAHKRATLLMCDVMFDASKYLTTDIVNNSIIASVKGLINKVVMFFVTLFV